MTDIFSNAYEDDGFETVFELFAMNMVARTVREDPDLVERDKSTASVKEKQAGYTETTLKYMKRTQNMSSSVDLASRGIFIDICQSVENNYCCFQLRKVAIGIEGSNRMQRCTAAMKHLSFQVCDDLAAGN